jgi:hypothetical protein
MGSDGCPCTCERTDAEGTVLHIDGGKPMQLDGPIVLCGRSDNDTQRGYNGRLSQLAIFDTALSPLQVYYAYKQVSPARGSSASVLSWQGSLNGTLRSKSGWLDDHLKVLCDAEQACMRFVEWLTLSTCCHASHSQLRRRQHLPLDSHTPSQATPSGCLETGLHASSAKKCKVTSKSRS